MQEMSIDAVRTAAESVIENLPPYWKEFRTKQLSRVSEEISWIYSPQGTVVDLGGSNGFHASVCSKLGMQSFCVDNFKVRLKGSKWDYFYEQDLEAETVATSLGVQFMCDSFSSKVSKPSFHLKNTTTYVELARDDRKLSLSNDKQ